ncbi:MAG: GNAT family N-acetyltransferase [Hyphomicrobiales bacterium]|nr:GNAT family N-acetyltransferase [Hyphomicrobiales bacterium]
METPPSLPRDFTVDRAGAEAVIQRGLAAGGGMLSDPETKLLLACYGIPTVEARIARNVDEAEAIARKLLQKTPEIALKILSPEISHKSEVGGVALNLRTAEDVRKAVGLMLERATKLRPEAHITGFTVQAMINRLRAHELIMGVAQDSIFGPVIIFGAGGTAVEVIKDKCLGLPPLNLTLARNLIEGTRVFKLLQGYRDRPSADIDGLALTLVRISQLIADFPAIEELDINPMLADEQGALAIDARLKLNPAWAHLKTPNPRFAIRPYPSQWEKTTTTQSEQPLLLRPILPTDEAAYKAFLSGVSPTDIRSRSFTSMDEFPHDFMARFTQIDYGREMAFVAIDPASGDILGVSRVSADPDYREAEYAVLVTSSRQGQGIGWALMQHLVDYAKAEGLQQLYGDVLAGNTTMLAMCQKLGFNVETDRDDPKVSRVALNLITQPVEPRPATGFRRYF